MAIGILAIWIGLGAVLTALVSYWVAMLRTARAEAATRRAALSGAAAPVPAAAGRKRRGGSAARSRRADPASTDPAARTVRVARLAFYVSCACMAIAAVTLESLILSQRYEIFYIWKNSYAALPFFYRRLRLLGWRHKSRARVFQNGQP